MCVYSYDMGIDMAFSFTQFFQGGGWYPWGEPMKEPFTISAKKLNRILQRPDAESKYWKNVMFLRDFEPAIGQESTKSAKKCVKIGFCARILIFNRMKGFWEIQGGWKLLCA